MKTLFSRHSTLNTGLPTATALTGSLISRTVKWFKAVSTWRICPRSGFCTSTFCPQAGKERAATARKEFQNLCTFPPPRILIYGLSRRPRPRASWTGFGSRWSFSLCRGRARITRRRLFAASVVTRLAQGRRCAFYGGVLADIVEHQLAIADRAGPVSHREGLHAIDGFPVHEHFALLQYLKEEDLALVSAAVAVGELFNEKDAAILVKLDFTIHEIGHEHLHRRAAGLLRNLVDDFLWKGMEQQRAISLPRTDDCVQGLAPAAPVLLLPVSPRSNDRPQSLKLFARPLFVSVDGTSGGVAPGACFVPG